jgi:dimethylglycine dehydrogenase
MDATHTRVVVIGGGCVGASVLYGLTQRGWTDVVLLERTQLTAGSTWHAAGLIPTFTRSHTVGRMIKKSLEIYEHLDASTGQSVGWHRCGHLRVARTPERMDEFTSYMSLAETQGIAARLVSPREILELWPLIGTADGMLGGLYHPDDGHIASADVTQALAKAARDAGAQVHLNTEVTGFDQLPDGGWRVRTNRGDFVCEHVVSATGNYARQTAAMVGLDLPAIPIVHQYWITEAMAQVRDRRAQGLPEMPILRDESFAGYMREEGEGLLFGPYERPEHLKLFAVDGVPAWFGADLLPEDFDAVEEHWAAAVDLVPSLQATGIRSNVRGPFQMTPDELPLAGPAWGGLPNFWLAEGVPGGILWGGTLGHYLSEWIVEGGTSVDMSELDPRRFGDYATKSWTRAKVQEVWGTHPDVRFPGEELPAGRPAKTAPSYDRLTGLGAVWSVMNGWEMPKWFATDATAATDDYSYRRSKHYRCVEAEVDAVRSGVGLFEMTPMTKFEVSGPGAQAWLDGLLANRLPSVGRIALAHHLTSAGTVIAEYTVTRLTEDRFYLVSTPRAERHNLDVLSRLLPSDGSVRLHNATGERGCFAIVGPQARELLQPLTEADLSNEGFPWLTARSATVGWAPDVRLLRVTYEGELGWELYHPISYQRHLLDLLLQQGVTGGTGLHLFGLEALESMRLDKSYRAMYRDMNTEYTALESGLDRFVKLDKDTFAGQEALLKQAAEGVPRRLVTLQVAPGAGNLFGGEGVFHQARLVGRVGSGGYSYHLDYDIALAFVSSDQAAEGNRLEIPVLGERRPATVIADSPYDPTNQRCRM